MEEEPSVITDMKDIIEDYNIFSEFDNNNNDQNLDFIIKMMNYQILTEDGTIIKIES